MERSHRKWITISSKKSLCEPHLRIFQTFTGWMRNLLRSLCARFCFFFSKYWNWCPPVISVVAVTKIVNVTHGSSSETLLNWWQIFQTSASLNGISSLWPDDVVGMRQNLNLKDVDVTLSRGRRVQERTHTHRHTRRAASWLLLSHWSSADTWRERERERDRAINVRSEWVKISLIITAQFKKTSQHVSYNL